MRYAACLLLAACASTTEPVAVAGKPVRFDACDDAYLAAEYGCHDESCRYEASVLYRQCARERTVDSH